MKVYTEHNTKPKQSTFLVIPQKKVLTFTVMNEIFDIYLTSALKKLGFQIMENQSKSKMFELGVVQLQEVN